MKKTLLVLLVLIFSFNICVSAEPVVNAKSSILMEASTGSILYENNANEQLPPASVTKIMTVLLIMEALERGDITYDTVVTASERAKSMGGSTIYLDAGEKMSVKDLLKGITVASANDACVAMGEFLAGSEENFVNMMNNRASELGMLNTHFENTNGLDSDNHYSSAYDIAIMARELLKHKDIFNFTTIWMDTLRDGKFQLANTNKLIRFYKGANGLKTGSTSKAHCCLCGTAERDGMQLIAVVLASPNSKERFKSVSNMLDYGFDNYFTVGNEEENKKVSEVKVKKGKKDSVGAVVKNGYRAVIKKQDKEKINKQVSIQECVTAPIKKDAELGKITYTLEGEIIGETTVVAEEDVPKKTPLDFFFDFARGITR